MGRWGGGAVRRRLVSDAAQMRGDQAVAEHAQPGNEAEGREPATPGAGPQTKVEAQRRCLFQTARPPSLALFLPSPAPPWARHPRALSRMAAALPAALTSGSRAAVMTSGGM